MGNRVLTELSRRGTLKLAAAVAGGLAWWSQVDAGSSYLTTVLPGAIVFGLDDNVIRFGSGDADFIHGHGLHILPVRCNDREFQSRYAHIEDAHRGAVDES